MSMATNDTTTRRRALSARHKDLLKAALLERLSRKARPVLEQEYRELLSIVQEAEGVLVDLPEGSRWS